jgi:RNA polymerase sigma-70 factor (ECF subfamily)
VPRSLGRPVSHPPTRIPLDGDGPDLRYLFETHYASIWRLLRRLGVPLDVLDDATQEVFWVAARRLHDIKRGSEHAFLYGVALRVASNQRRLYRDQSLICSLDQAPELRAQTENPEENCAQRRDRELLDEVLSRMPEVSRIPFVLHELESLEVPEIAKLLEIPVGTAASRLRRGRREFSEIATRIRLILERGGRP